MINSEEDNGIPMIGEEMTVRMFGCNSEMLAWKSGKKIVVMCDECGKHRIVRKQAYSDLCKSCALKGKKHSEETKQKLSDARKGKNHSFYGKKHSEETKQKMSDAHKNMSKETRQKMSDAHKNMSKETRQKISDAHKNPSEESRQRTSATLQGIPYDEWESFAKDQLYCPKFNESCRESNREKYDRKCFICGLPESENITKAGKVCRLSVHHCDMDKNQGCDGAKWKLVPLCMEHHGIAHNKLWASRIVWLLNNVYIAVC